VPQGRVALLTGRHRRDRRGQLRLAPRPGVLLVFAAATHVLQPLLTRFRDLQPGRSIDRVNAHHREITHRKRGVKMFQLHAEVSCSHSSEPPRLHCVQARSAEKWHVPATSDSSSVTFTTAGHGMQWSCASASHPAAQAPGCIQLPVDDPHLGRGMRHGS